MAMAMAWGDRAKDASLVPVRLALGGSMVYHGLQKLRGAGPEQTGQMFEGVGIKPGKPWALATGIAETAAGFLAVVGLATRPAALAVLVTQAVAISKVHAPKGYDVMNGGMEYNLALMAIAAALLVAGPGRISAHEVVERAVDGDGTRALWRRARPTPLSRAVRLLK